MGQSIKVKITKIEPVKLKISVSIKHLTKDPYATTINKYEIGKIYPATVTKVQDYGCFAKLEEGLEGLIHQSELSWTKKNIHPGKILSTSQKVDVQLLEKDVEKRRLSLSYKNTMPNPWKKFGEDFKVGDSAEGTIKNITDYGLFVSIKNTELDGLIHYKDFSWSEKDSELQKFKKNQLIKFKILEINTKEEKIRLGLKQLGDDPFEFFMNKNVSDIVTGVVQSTTINGIYLQVGKKNLTVLIKKNQLAREQENQRTSRFVKGDKLDALISELDKEKRKVSLSIKALEEKQTKEAVKKYGSKDSGGILSDIFDFSKIKTKKNKK